MAICLQGVWVCTQPTSLTWCRNQLQSMYPHSVRPYMPLINSYWVQVHMYMGGDGRELCARTRVCMPRTQLLSQQKDDIRQIKPHLYRSCLISSSPLSLCLPSLSSFSLRSTFPLMLHSFPALKILMCKHNVPTKVRRCTTKATTQHKVSTNPTTTHGLAQSSRLKRFFTKEKNAITCGQSVFCRKQIGQGIGGLTQQLSIQITEHLKNHSCTMHNHSSTIHRNLCTQAQGYKINKQNNEDEFNQRGNLCN